jgi:hypothetical protein
MNVFPARIKHAQSFSGKQFLAAWEKFSGKPECLQ